ncbi:MAG: M48 family metallopeptidase [Candidatus Xenobiia bacterium LiM19]
MNIEVKRSYRRVHTITATLRDDRMVLHIPYHLSEEQEAFWVERMKSTLLSKRKKKEEDAQKYLDEMAQEINLRYFQGRASLLSIRYSARQKRIFGSCTPRKGTIRISRQARPFPSWVQYYIVLHEMAHLIYPNHSKGFWAIVKQYHLWEKARGFLTGYVYGKAHRK